MTRLRKTGRNPGAGVDSPCIDVCRMEGKLCVGCQRTLDEIVRWANAGDEEKREILSAVALRRAALAPGGQANCNCAGQ